MYLSQYGRLNTEDINFIDGTTNRPSLSQNVDNYEKLAIIILEKTTNSICDNRLITSVDGERYQDITRESTFEITVEGVMSEFYAKSIYSLLTNYTKMLYNNNVRIKFFPESLTEDKQEIHSTVSSMVSSQVSINAIVYEKRELEKIGKIVFCQEDS